MSVGSLGYIGIQSMKTTEWTRYFTEFLGLMDVSDGEGEQRFRMDGQSWRFSVEKGEKEDIVFAGFETANAEALAALCDRLKKLDYHVEADPALAEKRNVTALWRTEDPDGLSIELYYGATDVSHSNFTSPAGVSGFKTENEGLGHIVLFTKDMAKTKRFYMEGLGFRLSDTIAVGPMLAVFMHCNGRHHTLATAEAPVDKRLNHFMIEAKTLNDVGYASERALAMDIPVTSTLGRHTNDQMISFYARTPSGFEIEFGYGGRTIDEHWSVAHYDAVSIWGHKQEGTPT